MNNAKWLQIKGYKCSPECLAIELSKVACMRGIDNVEENKFSLDFLNLHGGVISSASFTTKDERDRVFSHILNVIDWSQYN